MRNPQRIPKILDELKGVWSTFPDLRLGQLLLNVLNDRELYYVEDKDLLKYLRDHYSEVKNFEANQSKISNQG